MQRHLQTQAARLYGRQTCCLGSGMPQDPQAAAPEGQAPMLFLLNSRWLMQARRGAPRPMGRLPMLSLGKICWSSRAGARGRTQAHGQAARDERALLQRLIVVRAHHQRVLHLPRARVRVRSAGPGSRTC